MTGSPESIYKKRAEIEKDDPEALYTIGVLCWDKVYHGGLTLDLGLFNGPNDAANAGRRQALAERAALAADLFADGNIAGAIDELTGLLKKIDGQPPSPDWMDASAEKTALATQVLDNELAVKK